MKTLTRADLANTIHKELGFSNSESADLVDSFFEEIIQALEEYPWVKLSSFGTFETREKRTRMGRNPKTKKEIPISARRVVTFHASNLLVDSVNNANETAAARENRKVA